MFECSAAPSHVVTKLSDTDDAYWTFYHLVDCDGWRVNRSEEVCTSLDMAGQRIRPNVRSSRVWGTQPQRTRQLIRQVVKESHGKPGVHADCLEEALTDVLLLGKDHLYQSDPVEASKDGNG